MNAAKKEKLDRELAAVAVGWRMNDARVLVPLELHGRIVFARHVTPEESNEVCADCNCPASLKMFEAVPSSDPRFPSRWFYCGQCSIG